MECSHKTEAEVREELRRRVQKVETQKEAATVLGVSAQYLNDVLRGRREIAATLAQALGYQRITLFTALGGGA